MALPTEKFEVRNRWTNAVQFTAEITCAPDATIGVKLGLAIRWAARRDNDADLSGADLRGADLRGAVLSGADLSGAVLSGAVLSGAVLSGAVLSGAVLSGADLSGADLRGAVLRRADLRDAVLSDADLSGAVLSGADLRGAVLSGAVLPDWIPRIPDIHQRIFAAASADGALDMSAWHRTGCCGTTHCRAGHVVVQAGDGGRILEGVYGTAAAAAMIYAASDPSLECTPNFYASNAEALEDMKRLADLETARATPAP